MYIDRDVLLVGWLVGQERKSRLNGASYLYLGYYETLLLWEQEAKSYSVIHHHGDRFFVMAALCDGGTLRWRTGIVIGDKPFL